MRKRELIQLLLHVLRHLNPLTLGATAAAYVFLSRAGFDTAHRIVVLVVASTIAQAVAPQAQASALVVMVDGKMVETAEARHAAAMALLERFRQKREPETAPSPATDSETPDAAAHDPEP
jgi:hypothetical protein